LAFALLPVVMPMAVQPDTLTRHELETLRRLLPNYRVLLHNDDVHAMEYVVRALLRTVQHLTAERAVEIMLEAHLKGKAVVIVCPKETAEFYRAGLEGYGLTSTIEPE
jgi:ATP-dependent Clp protease adaptor protein ClpS